MPETGNLIAFIGAALVLLLTPGPAVLFVVTRSIQNGRIAGLVSTLGLTAGGLIHVIAAVLGISALVASSSEVFNALKWIGGGYLIYLGIKTLLNPASSLVESNFNRKPLYRLFWDGFVVNIFNPKPALFFLAFLPQFVTPSIAPVQQQLLTLGLLFLILALITDSAYALTAAWLRDWIINSPRAMQMKRYLSGSIYIGLGVSAAFTGRRSN